MGRLSAIIVIGLVAAIIGGAAPAAPLATPAPPPAATPVPPVARPAGSEVKAQAEKALREERRAAADLKAQQDMANWAMLMFAASLGGLIVSGGSIWLIWRTLSETREGVRHAQRSADAAVAMQRPWIDVEFRPTGPLEMEFPSVEDGTIMYRVPMEMTLHNRGGTPAQSIRHGKDAASHPYDDADIERYWPKAAEFAADEATANVGMTLFPDRELVLDAGYIFLSNLTETDNGQFTITFGVVITYQWGDSYEGTTKVTGHLICENQSTAVSDGWRFSLPDLAQGAKLKFRVERHRFRDQYV